MDKSDIAEDMQKIKAKLAIRYQIPFDKQAVKAIYDEQQLKVDRSDPFLAQVNAVGVVTDAPLGTQESYGTAVLISPCHVLINAHSVTKNAVREGKSPIYVSLGQTSCDSKNEFAHQDVQGQVVAMGDYSEVDLNIDSAKDYAIVRIHIIEDVKFVRMASSGMTKFDALMKVGFPFSSTYSQKTSLRYPTANFLRMSETRTDGIFKTINKSSLQGSSGSAVFVLDEFNAKPILTLSGIHQAQGQGIHISSILRDLISNHAIANKELRSAILSGYCK